MLQKIVCSICLIGCCAYARGQRTDSTLSVGRNGTDTIYWMRENVRDHRFLGNSTYVGASCTVSSSREILFNIGRTYGVDYASPGSMGLYTKAYGIGYSHIYKGVGKGEAFSAFYEWSSFFLPPATLRADYIYHKQSSNHYLRPTAGLNLGPIDLLYSYSFQLSGISNEFKHGFTVRLKYHFNPKNWEHHYPKWPEHERD